MDSKTKHRILGILVIAGLIVLALPFFQSNHEFSGKSDSVNPPPFPDQSAETTVQPGSVPTVNDAKAPTPLALPSTDPSPEKENTDQSPADTIHSTSIEQAAPTPMPLTPSNESASQQANVKEANPSVASPQQTAQANLKEMDEDVAAIGHSRADQAALLEAAVKLINEQEQHKVSSKPTKTVAVNKLHKRADVKALLRAPIENDGLFKLKNAAYVVQLGSYPTKAKALKVVNQLRAKGYHAFIQQFSSHKNDSIRVFVGPEKKHATARRLATEIERDTKLHGMVISYKPLSL